MLGRCTSGAINRSHQRRIRAGWLIDGTGGPILRDVVVCLDHGLIQTIAPAAGRDHDGTSVLDLAGFTLLPALVDAHAHLAFGAAQPIGFPADWETAAAVIEDHVQRYLACGIAAVRDGGDCRGWVRRYAENQRAAVFPLTVRPSGSAWHRKGRYGRLIGSGLAEGQLPAALRQSPSETPGHVKIVQSGINSLSVFGRQSPPQFGLDELGAAVKIAHGSGLKVMAHANGFLPVQIAVAAGCDSIEHGYFMGRRNLAAMAERQTTWVPTLAPMQAFTQMEGLEPAARDIARRTLAHQLEQLAAARTMGVPIALGTDAGSPGVAHGAGVIDELGLLMAAGFSLSQAIAIGTSRAARLLDLNNSGALRPQQEANFVAVAGPPTGLPQALINQPRLYIRGEPWPREQSRSTPYR